MISIQKIHFITETVVLTTDKTATECEYWHSANQQDAHQSAPMRDLRELKNWTVVQLRLTRASESCISHCLF